MFAIWLACDQLMSPAFACSRYCWICASSASESPASAVMFSVYPAEGVHPPPEPEGAETVPVPLPRDVPCPVPMMSLVPR